MSMDALKIYRTYRSFALDLAARHDVPVEQALLVRARAASQCPPKLGPDQITRYVHAELEHGIVELQQSGRGLRETG
jgi:hypothetical protein